MTVQKAGVRVQTTIVPELQEPATPQVALDPAPTRFEKGSSGVQKVGKVRSFGPQLDPLRVPNNPADAALAAFSVGRWNREGATLVTASSVEQLLASGDLSSIQPPIPRQLWPLAISLLKALSADGPLGSRGPLGPDGPVGNQPHNPSFWMQKRGNWQDVAEELHKLGGPGSEAGPLGKNGPLSKSAYEQLLPLVNQLSQQLQAGGLFAALGPLGPLGALGALGYLGLMGGHGYGTNDRGEFVDKSGKVVQTAEVVYEGKKRSYGLVEFYPKNVAQNQISDTSWMVRGKVDQAGQSDDFRFRTANHAQFVTISAVPETHADSFTLELYDKKGNLVARSDSDALVNWIQIESDKARELSVKVVLKESRPSENLLAHPTSLYIDTMLAPLKAWGYFAEPWLKAAGYQVERPEKGGYRLMVVGGTEELSKSQISGDHQSRVRWAD